MSLERRRFPDPAALAEALADAVAEALAQALAARGRASLALPGGTTPGPFLEVLGRRPLDWAKVTAFPGDERWVPETSPRSNFALLRPALPAARLLTFYREALDPEAAAAALSAELEPLLPLDVAVLGMGEDGHTASLFPGSPQLAAALDPAAPAVLAVTAPGQPEPRLSLTARVFQAARLVFVLFHGAAKESVLDRVLAPGPVEDLPLRLLLGRQGPSLAMSAP